jgi:hypothetical protein
LEEAAAKLEELLVQDPNYALAHSAVAVVYGRLKEHDKATAYADGVCHFEPNDAFSFAALSVTDQRAGRIREAEDAKPRAHMMGRMH